MTPAGKRRTRVTFKRLKSGLTQDAGGHINEKDEANWEEYIQRWVKAEYGGGFESLVGDQLQASTLWILTAPNDSETRMLKPKMRVSWSDGTVTHDCAISEPPASPDDMQRDMVIRCLEVRR